jgi:beta-lactamase class A
VSAEPVADRLRAVLAAAGSTGWVHARDVDGAREVGLDADRRVSLASVAKVALLVAFARLVDAGRLDAGEPVEVPAGSRTQGLTGLSVMRDPVRISLRDLALMMITVSDNAAADRLFAAVGLDAVNGAMRELGLPGIAVPETMADLYARLAEETGGPTAAEAAVRLTDARAVGRLAVLDPALSASATPRDLTALLVAIWRDEAASPAACAEMRRLLGLQVWPHRLASGFPSDEIQVSGKTGSLPTLRHEIGVVEYPDGGRYAVAVLTQTSLPAPTQPPADAAIGTVARIAVEHLRGLPRH